MTTPTLSDARRAALDILSSRTMADAHEPRVLADFVMGLTDERPIDEAWLRSIGFVQLRVDALAFWFNLPRAEGSRLTFRTDRERFHLYSDGDTVPMPDIKTRGQLNLLLLALKGE